MKYTKIPFYFRTIAQYDDAKEYLSLLTAEAYQKFEAYVFARLYYDAVNSIWYE